MLLSSNADKIPLKEAHFIFRFNKSLFLIPYCRSPFSASNDGDADDHADNYSDDDNVFLIFANIQM